MEENKKCRKSFRAISIIAFIVIIIGMIMVSGINEASISIATTIIVILLVTVFLRYKFPERYQKDERTKKLGAFALSYSWMITFVTAAALFWLLDLEIIKMSGAQTAGALFALMTITMLLFQGYFLHKGDA